MKTSAAGGACVATVCAAVWTLTTAAYACVPPVVTLTPPSAPPGTEVTLTGSARVKNEIVFHWNGASGPVLARVTPAGSKVRATFTVPDAPPGHYLVTAVQPGNFGNTLLGRVSFEVVGPGGERAAGGPGGDGSAGAAEPAPGSVLPFVLAFGALALLGTTGIVLVARHRRVGVPASGSNE